MSDFAIPEHLRKEIVLPTLQPINDILLDGFWNGFDWVQKLIASDDRAAGILYSSTVAGMVSDSFSYFCRPTLTAEHGARWRSRGRFHQALIQSTIALRFKKMTPDKLTMNIPTAAQDLVYRQQEPLLPGTKLLAQVTLGYTLNHSGTEVTGIYYQCPRDYKRNWWIESLYEAGGGQLNMFTNSPTPPDDQVEDVLNVKIRVPGRKVDGA